MKITRRLYNAQQAHVEWSDLWKVIKAGTIAGHRYEVTVASERRSLPQNSRLWAMLEELASQVEWHGQYLSKEEWKDILTAALKRQKVVPGIDGGFVVLGSYTSKMDKAELSELMELAAAFGAEHGVVFRDPSA